MFASPDPFDRIKGRVNVRWLATKLVAVVGIGTVGSQLARELANTGVGRLRLIDHDLLEVHNLPRHALTSDYVGHNKAEATALYLSKNIKTLHVESIPYKIDQSFSDSELDQLLRDADLIVAATDDRDAQRRLGRQALSLDIPAVLPALYADGGGEIFVQLSPSDPCFFCWDGFRPNNEQLRAVGAVNADALPVISLAVQLSLEVLDSSAGDLFDVPPNDPRPRQLFVQRPLAAPSVGPAQHRWDCPSCAVGPAGSEVMQPSSPRENMHAADGSQTTRSRRELLDVVLSMIPSAGILAAVFLFLPFGLAIAAGAGLIPDEGWTWTVYVSFLLGMIFAAIAITDA